MNQISYKLVSKKIRKDIESVMTFIDDENTNKIMFSGVGYSFFFLGVYKIIFNEQYDLDNLSEE